MKSMNFGCGREIKEGWTNIDRVEHPGVDVCDIMDDWPYSGYDLILVEHVLHMFTPIEHAAVLKTLYNTLNPGGRLQVVEFDPVKAFEAYQRHDRESLIIPDKLEPTLDGKLSFLLTYHGMRRSILTKTTMVDRLVATGFSKVVEPNIFPFNREKESFFLEATK